MAALMTHESWIFADEFCVCSSSRSNTLAMASLDNGNKRESATTEGNQQVRAQ